MKQLIRLTILFCACAALALTVVAGPEPLPSGKEMKEVAPAPPPMCEWTGFYIGMHAGAQFGHSQTLDFASADGDVFIDRRFGYEENGFNGGLQFGYNWQWHWLVLSPEFDVGYMNLEGRGEEPGQGGTVHGETDSDFYTTLRGRIGVALDWHGCWLIYGTGGGIGLNYTTRFHVDPNFFDARTCDFNWGYTVGGGIERQILNRHWSLKVEYLYFSLEEQDFENSREVELRGMGAGFAPTPQQPGSVTISGHFTGETFGHIIRAGLNYRF